jgi:hypothetical protein
LQRSSTSSGYKREDQAPLLPLPLTKLIHNHRDNGFEEDDEGTS